MMTELVIGPSLPNKRGLLIWDNCRPHKVHAVRATFEEWGIETQELPPRMMGLLQVMDLVVNGL